MGKTLITRVAAALIAAMTFVGGGQAVAATIDDTCDPNEDFVLIAIGASIADCAKGMGRGADALLTSPGLFGTDKWYEVPSGGGPVFGVIFDSDINGPIFSFSFAGLKANQSGVLVIDSLDMSGGAIEYVAYLFTVASTGGTGVFSASNLTNPFFTKGPAAPFDVSFFVTPLPAALPLFATGLAALGFVTRRRKA